MITDGNATQVFYHSGSMSFAPKVLTNVHFGVSKNITVQLFTRRSGSHINIKFAILKKGLASGMLDMIRCNVTGAAADVADACAATSCFRVFSYDISGVAPGA